MTRSESLCLLSDDRSLTRTPDNQEPWDFSKHPAADLVVINIGTNDKRPTNNVSTADYIDALTKIIQGVHGKWPKAQVVVMVGLVFIPTLGASIISWKWDVLTLPLTQTLWLGFYQSGNTYLSNATEGWAKETYDMVQW